MSEVGNKCSKLQKVEIHISIEALKVIDAKTRVSLECFSFVQNLNRGTLGNKFCGDFI